MKNSTAKSVPSSTQIKKALTLAAFNPKLPGTMKVISEVGNPDYYLTRAREAIAQAEALREQLRQAEAMQLALCMDNVSHPDSSTESRCKDSDSKVADLKSQITDQAILAIRLLALTHAST